MKCLRLVCLVSFIITPIFASDSDSDADWEDLAKQKVRTNPLSSAFTKSSDHDESDESDTDVAAPRKNPKLAALQLSLLDMRALLDKVFNSLNAAQPNFDEAIDALSQHQHLLAEKIPGMVLQFQLLKKELQDASAQSKGDNETKDNA